ncbi:MAG: hypothetical protein ACRD1H_11210, partial [Vicinamibacterales bacterium]
MADREARPRQQRGGPRTWIGEPPRSEPPVVDGYLLAAHERFDIVRGSLSGLVLMPFWWLFFTVV